MIVKNSIAARTAFRAAVSETKSTRFDVLLTLSRSVKIGTGQSGSVLIELLAVSLFFVLLLEAIIGFGMGYREYGVVVDAARAAGRAAAGYNGTENGDYICNLAHEAANGVLSAANLNPDLYQITVQSEDLDSTAAIGANTPAIRVTVQNQDPSPINRLFIRGSATSLFFLESRNSAVGGC